MAHELVPRGIYRVSYMGGLEQRQHFERVADSALIGTTALPFDEQKLLTVIEGILASLGRLEGVTASGLEQFANNLAQYVTQA